MKKFCNVRFFVLLFMAFVFGHIFAVYSSISRTILYVEFFIACAIMITGSVMIFANYKKYIRFLLKSVICILACIICMCMTLIRIELQSRDNKIPTANYVISGEVVSINYENNIAYIDNVMLNAGEYKVYGKCKLNLFLEATELEVGDNIIFVGEYNPNFIPKLYETYSAKLQLNSDSLLARAESSSFSYKIRKSIKQKLNSVASEDVAQIQYAMLFGDKSGLNEVTKDQFSMVGLSHLLAVSGLHIGFVIAVISKLLDWLIKNKRWVSFAIKSLLILGYLVLCNFAISATRAVIMSMVLLYADARGKRYDALSALSFAGCLIMMINPYQFFDVGFQLSFMVVFGLIGIAPLFSRLFEKVMPNWLNKSLSISISSQIASFPIIAYNFSNIPVLAMILNMIVIPYVSIAFMLLCISCIISVIIPPFSAILKLPSVLFRLLIYVVDSISRLDIISIKFGLETLATIFAVLSILVASQFNLMNKRNKAMFTLVLLAISTVFVIFNI